MNKRNILFPVFFIFIIFVILIFIFLKDSKGYIQTIFFGPQTILLHIVQIFNPSQGQLKEENIKLNTSLVKMNLLKADNESLRDQFQAVSPSQQKLLPAEIVAMPQFLPGFSMPEEYILHIGITEKAFVNAPVVFKDNLIGKIIQIQDHFSKVLLVSNKNTSFTGKTSETGANGVVKGGGNGAMTLDNVLLSDTLKVGDIVITGGEVDVNGKGIPPGLIVGKITSVEKNPSNLFQKGSVQSLVNFSKLTKVFVLISN